MKSRFLYLAAGLLLALGILAGCALPQAVAEPSPTPAPTDNSPFGESANNPGFCPANLATPVQSSMIRSVTMAKKISEDNSPVDPTNEFGATDMLHAVVAIDNAPAGTRFKAVWVVVDIGDPSTCNTKIAEYEITTEGTRNIDFNVSPEPSWPAGKYKVEFYINGALDREESYTIQ